MNSKCWIIRFFLLICVQNHLINLITMAKAQRIALIKQIEDHRQSKVLTYITSTRQNAEVQMALDCIRKFYEHLKFITPEERNNIVIDLLIVSNGGDGTVPWRLVTLLREYAKEFNVLVPYRAFSAATLTALGADKIFMHPMGMLGPTDPTVANAFNPDDPKNPNQKIGISVEDVTAYIALIKEDADIRHEDELIQAFKILADKVHPLALGNVKRSLSQSKMMAQKLLSLHMNKGTDQHSIDEISDNLTSKLYYHGHPINRKEAKQIGLKNIADPDEVLEKLIWDLYVEYENEIKSDEPFDPAMEFIANNPALAAGTTATHEINTKIAFIECVNRTDYVSIKYAIQGKKLDNGSHQITANVIERGWKIE
ncbi:MAG: hypothetical protein QM791_02150 [Ferruginibacter sp.]